MSFKFPRLQEKNQSIKQLPRFEFEAVILYSIHNTVNLISSLLTEPLSAWWWIYQVNNNSVGDKR